jgi:hypothetical protein
LHFTTQRLTPDITALEDAMRGIRLAIVSVLGVFTLSGAAVGQATSTPGQPISTPTQPAPDDKDQIICKDMPAPTGTRLAGERQCRTKRDWDQQMRDSQDILNYWQKQGTLSCGPTC